MMEVVEEEQRKGTDGEQEQMTQVRTLWEAPLWLVRATMSTQGQATGFFKDNLTCNKSKNELA